MQIFSSILGHILIFFSPFEITIYKSVIWCFCYSIAMICDLRGTLEDSMAGQTHQADRSYLGNFIGEREGSGKGEGGRKREKEMEREKETDTCLRDRDLLPQKTVERKRE